jgi:hypothetical protein
MTEIPISPEIWKLAAEILTEKQLTVLTLRERHGYSWNMLAINFNCTRSNVREIHRAATKKLLDAIQSAGGDIDLALERTQPRPDSEETHGDDRERDADRSHDQQARPGTERRDPDPDHRPQLSAKAERGRPDEAAAARSAR